MRKIILGLGLAVTLAACAPQSTTQAVNNDVDAAVIALTAAETLALHYTSLPRCPASVVCSDEVLVAKIKAADQKAYAAVKLAQANSSLVADAIAAITILKNLVPSSV